MPPLVSYNENGDVEDSDAESATQSPNAAVANSDATASEIGSPVHVVPPEIANLLRGAVAVGPSVDAERLADWRAYSYMNITYSTLNLHHSSLGNNLSAPKTASKS